MAGFRHQDHLDPSVVIMVAPRRLSHASPCLRINQPMPPPSVSPAIPVVEKARPPAGDGGAHRSVKRLHVHGLTVVVGVGGQTPDCASTLPAATAPASAA
jgi:hypothetical protein